MSSLKACVSPCTAFQYNIHWTYFVLPVRIQYVNTFKVCPYLCVLPCCTYCVLPVSILFVTMSSMKESVLPCKHAICVTFCVCYNVVHIVCYHVKHARKCVLPCKHAMCVTMQYFYLFVCYHVVHICCVLPCKHAMSFSLHLWSSEAAILSPHSSPFKCYTLGRKRWIYVLDKLNLSLFYVNCELCVEKSFS